MRDVSRVLPHTGRVGETVERRLEYVPLEDLVPAERNPKRHDLPAIGRSIDRFGYVEPIVLDERTGRLVAGHGRLEQLSTARAAGGDAPEGVTVAADGGWRVPVLRGWASRSDADAAAYLAASNRLVELGGWDDVELGRLLADVTAVDADLAAVAGFDAAELSRLLSAAQGGPEARTDPDDAPMVPAEPVTRPGDVWLLGPHRLVCGDSTDEVVLKTLMADDLADCVWTDPPYGVAYTAKNAMLNAQDGGTRLETGIGSDELDGEALAAFLTSSLGNALAHSRPGAAWWVAAPGMAQPLRAYANVLCDLGVWRHTLVWVKDGLVLGRSDYHGRHEQLLYGWAPGGPHTPPPNRSQDSVWEVPRPRKNDLHPTMKPVALIERAITNHTDHGAVVLDPFGGSGSTLIACHATGRRARLVELDPAYCDVIAHRYQDHTGVVPVLEATGEPHDFTAA